MAKKREAKMQEEEILDTEDGVRVYELGFHLDPELPIEEVKKAYQAIRESIGAKSVIVAEGEPQMIPLAYTISRQGASGSPRSSSGEAGRRDFTSAYFSWIAYESSVPNHAEVLATANADKHIIRFIDLLTTKDAARHAVEIREFSAKTPEHVEEPEAITDAELDVALQNVAL